MRVRLFVGAFLLFWTSGPLPPIVDGHPTMQCVQTGAGSIARFTIYDGLRKWTERRGSYTLGAARFDSAYGGAMGAAWVTKDPMFWWDLFKDNYGNERRDCPYNFNPSAATEVLLCDQDDFRVKLRINAVQQTDASGKTHTLAGWLNIEVELVDPGDTIRQLYIQMYDEYFNAVGEFVSNPTEQCEASDPTKFVSPTAYQTLPCAAIGAREVQASQAVYMVNSDDLFEKSLKGSKYLPKEEMARGVHFTWRMNEYWCNRHYRITPMVFIVTTKNINDWHHTTASGTRPDPAFTTAPQFGWWKLYRKIPNYGLVPDWFGAADIKHPERGVLQCNNSVFNGTGFKQELSGEAPWIRDKFQHTVLQEYFRHGNGYVVAVYYGPRGEVYSVLGVDTCQQNPYFLRENAQFAGRCLHLKGDDTNKPTSHSFLHICNTNPNGPEFAGLNLTELNFRKYKNYTAELTAFRNATCHAPCRAPETLEDAIDISNLVDPVRNGTEGFTIGITYKHRSKINVAKFWRGRKFHGALCLIATMFLMPISNFMARYYKETFMKYQYHGVHIWFWVHSGATIGSVGLLICGQIALGEGIRSWGRSQSPYSVAHHAFGWTSILVTILMVILGKLRNAKRRWLKKIMVAHAVVGFTIHFFNIIQIYLSTFIPASPSLRRCGRDGLPTGISPTVYIAMAWFVLDGIFHGFLTALQMTADRTLMGMARPMYFPILPVLSPHSHVDMKRSGLRTLLLIFYVVLCTLFSFAATLHLSIRYPPEGCIVGEMSCKAALGCTRLGLAMCKKLKYDICTRKGSSKEIFY